jgi:hypothetical protein
VPCLTVVPWARHDELRLTCIVEQLDVYHLLPPRIQQGGTQPNAGPHVLRYRQVAGKNLAQLRRSGCIILQNAALWRTFRSFCEHRTVEGSLIRPSSA